MKNFRKAISAFLVLIFVLTLMPNQDIGLITKAASPEKGVFYNGDFESGPSGRADYWSNPSSAFSIITEENHTPGGSRCIKIANTGNLWQTFAYVGPDNSRSLPVESGAVYRVSFWHKGAANGQLEVGDYGVPGKNINVNDDADWTYYYKDFVIGTRTSLSPMDLKNNNGNASGPSYFDDFKIEIISTPVPFTPMPIPSPGIMETVEGKTSDMEVGTNFWFLTYWSGEKPFKENVNWATAYANGDDIWNPVFIEEIEPYKNLRFMDWGRTNNSDVMKWEERRLPNDPGNADVEQGSSPSGLAYEWMIDLCNRRNKDLWVCVPHFANDDYITKLAQLIKEQLDPDLKCYLEYSNEVWNSGFQQYRECEVLGKEVGFTENINARYYVYRSFQMFELFENVFASEMSKRVIKVCSFSGNMSLFDNGYAFISSSQEYNPNSQGADLFCVAPYVGGGIDGYDPDALLQFRDVAEKGLYQYVITASDIAKKHGVPLGAYEGGQHLTQGAHVLSANPYMYHLYLYMLNMYSPYFTVFCHYTHAGNWGAGGAWGAKSHTGQDIEDAPKYKALVDWINAPAQPTPDPTPLPYGQLANASFQDGVNAWQIYLKEGSYSVVTNDPERKHYLTFTNMYNENSGGFISTECRLKANTEYTVHYDMGGVNAEGKAQNTDVVILDRRTKLRLGSKNWQSVTVQRKEIDFTSPSHGEIELRVMVPGWPSNNNCTIKFDNVRFVERGQPIPQEDPVWPENVTPPTIGPTNPPATPSPKATLAPEATPTIKPTPAPGETAGPTVKPTAEPTVKPTVEPTESPKTPKPKKLTIKKITDKQKKISGVAKNIDKLVVNISGKNQNVTPKNSKWSLSFKKPLKAGSKVVVQGGGIKKRTHVIPAKPSIKKLKRGSKRVKGKGTKKGRVIIQIGKKTYRGKISRKGSYSVKVPKLKKGVKVKVRVKAGGKLSDVRTIKVK